jgi:hypothetical protein
MAVETLAWGYKSGCFRQSAKAIKPKTTDELHKKYLIIQGLIGRFS